MKYCFVITAIILLIQLNSHAQFPANGFQSKVDLTTGTNPQSCNHGDFNLDGKPDLISVNIGSNSITVYPNNTVNGVINSSSFGSSFTLTTLPSSPQLTCVADIDGDGKLDILLSYGASSNTNFSIFRNQFNGVTFNSASFGRFEFPSTGTQPNTLNAEDIDGDGKKDIVLTNAASGNISVFRNTSTSGSISLAAGQTYTVGTTPGNIAIEDMDNDGKRDVAVTNWGSNTVTIYKNQSTSGNIVLGSVQTLSTPTNPNYIKVTDLDNDNYKDIVVSNWAAGNLSFFKNISTSSIAFATRFDIALSGSTTYTQSVITNDLNDDGKPDVTVGVTGYNQLGLFKNIHTTGGLSAASFSARTNLDVNNSPVGIIAVDLDNDLRPDLVASNYSSANISVLKNKMLADEPSTQCSNFSASNSSNSITVSFTKGNGTRRIVLARAGSVVNVNPADTSFYSASTIFGSGSQIGSGNYVVYADTGNTFTLSGLSTGVNYYFSVYEFNGRGGFSNYLLSNPLTGSRGLGDVYYNKVSGDLNLTSSWGLNADGSGTPPASFNLSNTTFMVKNNISPSLGGNWFVTGSNVVVVFGDGVNSFNLSILPNETFGVDSFYVMRGITLTVQGGLISNKAYFDSLTTVQYTSNSAQNVSPYDYYNLLVSASAKTLSGNTSVKGSLILLNTIHTGSYNLTLGSSPSQTGTLQQISGNINGTFTRWFANSTNSGVSGLFPIAGGNLYRPVQVEFTSPPTAGGTITAQFISGDPGNIGLPIYDFSTAPVVNVNKTGKNGVWRLTSGNGLSGGTYTGTVTASGFFGVSVLNELRMVKRTLAGSWTITGTSLTPSGTLAAPVVARSGLSGFGEIGIGGDIAINPLPVKFIGLSGQKSPQGIELKWATAYEQNSELFQIERWQKNENTFVGIGSVQASGNSNNLKYYTFLDQENNLDNETIYRIREVDIDGSETLSNTWSIQSELDKSELQVFPNPAREMIQFNFVEPIASIRILNTRAQVLMEFQNMNNGQISLIDLPNGLYLAEVFFADGSNKTIRFIKE